MEPVPASPSIPTKYVCQGQHFIPESWTIHQIPKPTVPEPSVLQIKPVTDQRPTSLPKGMFLDILQTNVIQNVPQTVRLNYFLSRWRLITQDSWVLQTVQGHHIELMSPPVQYSLPGIPQLSPSQERVLDQEVEALLSKEAIHSVQTQTLNEGFISSMFIVSKKGGGNAQL